MILKTVALLCLLGAAPQVPPLTPKDRQEIIRGIGTKLVELYPFPDIARRTREGILAHHRAGRYRKIRSPRIFAHRVTSDLEALSRDKHLDLLYDPGLAEAITQREKKGADMDALEASEAKQLRWENYGFRSLTILDGHVGYLDLRVFFATPYAGRTALAAMDFLAPCRAVIIDLRRNGGGWGDMVMLLASYFVDAPRGKSVSVRYSTLQKEYSLAGISAFVPGRKMTGIPVYLLVSGSTASAAEAFGSTLRLLNENVKLVGEQTAGAENPVEMITLSAGFVLKIPCWKPVQSIAGYGWEGKGLTPDIPVPAADALGAAHLDALETLQKNAGDDLTREKLRWAFDGIRVATKPRTVARRILATCVGTYGESRVRLGKDVLIYRYKERPERRLLAIEDDYFAVEGCDDRRIRFVREGKKAVALKHIFSDGYETTAARQ